jgi:RimJ/RimL family protein N-acetyltransferase
LDAPLVRALAGDARIADTTTTIPHPYPEGAAEAWIAGHAASYTQAREATFAIQHETTGQLIGAVSLLDIQLKHRRAELGYWTGASFWGCGYCTEAVQSLVHHAPEAFGVTRIVGRCFARNLASARVMTKAGLQPEGLLRKHIQKNGVYEDVMLFGLILPGRGEA